MLIESKINSFKSYGTKIKLSKWIFFIVLFFICLLKFGNAKIVLVNHSVKYIVPNDLLFYSIAFLIFNLILPKFIFKNIKNYTFKFKEVLYVIILFITLTITIILIESVIKGKSSIWIYLTQQPLYVLISKLYLILLIGLVEEYVFRVIFLKQLTFTNIQIHLLIIINSLVFCIGHIYRAYTNEYSIAQSVFFLIEAFLLSVIICYIYVLSNNIPLIVMIHAFIDFQPVLLRKIGNSFFFIHAIIISLIILLFYILKKDYKMPKYN